MYRIGILAALALVMTAIPDPAHAGPAIAPLFTAIGFSSTTALALGNLTASVLLSVGARLLQSTPEQQRQRRELEVPSTTPPWRFAYGRTQMPGTPAPGWYERGGYLYQCLILNSRPSDGSGFSITFDDRVTTFAGGTGGNLTDFSSDGAKLDIEGYPSHSRDRDEPRVWLGLGDQTGPPDAIVAEDYPGNGDPAGSDPSRFWPTDGWRGRTVLWLRLRNGGSSVRQERWPRGVPSVKVIMDWSRVWDPRDESQDPGDPTTWTWSDNQALCLLDAIRQNPIRRWPLRNIWLDTWKYAADVADQMVGRKDAADEPRYRANGFISWQLGQEIEDQVSPLVAAGGGNLIKTNGLLGYAAGEYRAPIYTVTDVLDSQPLSFRRLARGRDLPRAVRGEFTWPEQQYETQHLKPYEVPGAKPLLSGEDDGIERLPLEMVTSPTQAMRISRISAQKKGAQRALSGELPPDAIDLIAGSTAQVDMPAPGDPRSGLYEVQQIHPARWIESEEGTALRLPVEMRETRSDIFEWDPEEHEQELPEVSFNPIDMSLPPPENLQLVADGNVISFTFDAPDEVDGGDQIDEYQWQWREAGGDWQTGGVIDGDTELSGTLSGLSVNAQYEIRVRSRSTARASDWVSDSVQTDEVTLDAPIDGEATGGELEIDVAFTIPNISSASQLGLEFYASDSDDVQTATLIREAIWGSANDRIEITEDGLDPDQTRYYWARTVDGAGGVSDLTGPVSATTDPAVEATGGSVDDVEQDGDWWRVHTFSDDGTFDVTRGGTIEYLAVAGGGAGGWRGGDGGGGGGGGAGGLLLGTTSLEVGQHPVVVGGGGATQDEDAGEDGESSTFAGSEAIGGGGGGRWSPPARDGGSGGGAAGRSNLTDAGGGSGVEGQGKDGGDRLVASNSQGGAGGGGAGSAGIDQDLEAPGGRSGGAGLEVGISGTTAAYAGGGGGGKADDGSASHGTGGTGGGGDGGQPGTANTGGGGGGGTDGGDEPGAGASGIVIVRYRIPAP